MFLETSDFNDYIELHSDEEYSNDSDYSNKKSKER